MVVADENFILFAFSALIVLILVLIIWIWKLERRMGRILGGKSINIEEAIIDGHKKLRELGNFRKETEEKIDSIKNKLKKSIRAVETIRFNPFKGTGEGGNQSFSSAFVNDDGNGVVLTGLYHRERISVFAKPIKNFNGEFELSEEEKGVLKNAKIKLRE